MQNFGTMAIIADSKKTHDLYLTRIPSFSPFSRNVLLHWFLNLHLRSRIRSKRSEIPQKSKYSCPRTSETFRYPFKRLLRMGGDNKDYYSFSLPQIFFPGETHQTKTLGQLVQKQSRTTFREDFQKKSLSFIELLGEMHQSLRCGTNEHFNLVFTGRPFPESIFQRWTNFKRPYLMNYVPLDAHIEAQKSQRKILLGSGQHPKKLPSTRRPLDMRLFRYNLMIRN